MMRQFKLKSTRCQQKIAHMTKYYVYLSIISCFYEYVSISILCIGIYFRAQFDIFLIQASLREWSFSLVAPIEICHTFGTF